MKPLIQSPVSCRQILKQNQHPEKDFSHGLGRFLPFQNSEQNAGKPQ
jgi:hypothetical protein